VELITGRLLLRRPVADDAADALLMLQDPEVVRWNPAPAVIDIETARAWCARGADWTGGTHATWHAVERSTGRLVANCTIFGIDRDQATARIGYRVAPWQRRCGVGSEVVGIVVRWAFAELGLARVQLEHAVANVGSCRVAVNAGSSWKVSCALHQWTAWANVTTITCTGAWPSISGPARRPKDPVMGKPAGQ
jgi:RimJ/RimL family protein N-acetyltransferase